MRLILASVSLPSGLVISVSVQYFTDPVTYGSRRARQDLQARTASSMFFLSELYRGCESIKSRHSNFIGNLLWVLCVCSFLFKKFPETEQDFRPIINFFMLTFRGYFASIMFLLHFVCMGQSISQKFTRVTFR